jgi:hypothetical protein
MKSRSALGAVLFTGIAATICAKPSQAANLADFDSLTEGFYPTLTSGGVTFSNLDDFTPLTPTDLFAIDNATPDLNGISGYSPPNVLGFNGFGPGEGVVFTRLGSFDFATGSQASSASLVWIAFDNAAGSTLQLQGIRNGNVVNSASINLNTTFQITSLTLSLGPGTYDSFKVVAHGTTQDGAVFGVIDNVTVNPVPEPAALGALVLAMVIVPRRRRR